MVVLHFLSVSRGQEKYILTVLKNRAGGFHLSYIFFPVSSDRRLSSLASLLPFQAQYTKIFCKFVPFSFSDGMQLSPASLYE